MLPTVFRSAFSLPYTPKDPGGQSSDPEIPWICYQVMAGIDKKGGISKILFNLAFANQVRRECVPN